MTADVLCIVGSICAGSLITAVAWIISAVAGRASARMRDNEMRAVAEALHRLALAIENLAHMRLPYAGEGLVANGVTSPEAGRETAFIEITRKPEESEDTVSSGQVETERQVGMQAKDLVGGGPEAMAYQGIADHRLGPNEDVQKSALLPLSSRSSDDSEVALALNTAETICISRSDVLHNTVQQIPPETPQSQRSAIISGDDVVDKLDSFFGLKK